MERKSLNGNATVVEGHATVGRLSNYVFSTFQAFRKHFEKSHWTVTRQWSEVTRRSADCQTTFFGRFKQSGKILKKVAERSRDSGRRTRDRLPTVKQRFFGRFKQLGEILKKVVERSRDSGRRSRDRRPTANYVFRTFQAIRKNFGKSRWTVTWQLSEVTRPSADCQTTFFRRFKQSGKILKKVAERSRDSGRRSRDRRPTVKQRFWTFQAIRNNFEKSRWTVTRQWSEVKRPSADCQTTYFGRFKQFEFFWKKSLNSHATVVWGHATVGWLSSTYM